MGHPAGKKEQGQIKIMESAGRGFRAKGFAGLGVDELARGAGMTSGAFYAHFSSKAEAFRRSVEVGLCRLAEGIQAIRKKEGKNWPDAFAELYVTDLRTCDLQESCALQSLTGDVFRADERTKAVFARGLEDVLIEAVGNEGDPDCRENIIALLALLSGGVSMARAVDNEELAAEIAEAVRSAAKKIHHM